MNKFQKAGIDKQFTVGRFNKISRKGVKINSSCVLSHNNYVGQSSTIE